jgi:hypothetical protein
MRQSSLSHMADAILDACGEVAKGPARAVDVRRAV